MPQSLPNQVRQVQAAATRLIWLYALARFGFAVVTTVVCLGLIDYVLRLHDPGVRWLLSFIAVGLAGFAFVKLALPALLFRQSPIATARRIELQFPELGERLSNAIAFLNQHEDDRTAGSPELRRAVIAEAEALASGLDFRAALDHRATRHAALAAAGALTVAAVLAALNPPVASLALSRLAQPWRELAWPRRHELAFVEPPQRLAKGDDFEVTLKDRGGPLPSDVQLLLRYETPSGWHTETKEIKPFGDRAVFHQGNVTRGFEYRARGGDDDTMPWIELAVVDPPKIVALDVLVEPPEYAGLAPHSEGRIVKALIGSRLRIRGKLDQPIRSAVIRPQTLDFPLPAVEIAADGRQFMAPAAGSNWTVERTGAFSFELIDQHGLAFGRDSRIELSAVQDTPPSIAWESPGDHSFVAARAAVPIKGVVKDDLAIRGVHLRYLRPGKSDEEQVLDLYTGQASNLPLKKSIGDGESRPIDFAFDLSRLAGLAPGDVLAVRLTAEDYKPQLATTTVRRLTIVTDEELQSRVAARQGAILSQLADALRLARQCRQQTDSLEKRLEETGRLSGGDLNLLEAAQHNQHQVERLLGASPEGAEGQIVALLAELAANHAENQANGQRLNELLTQLRDLNQGPIVAINQELIEALKAAQETTNQAQSRPACGDFASDETRRRLQNAGARQDEVVQSLERMVGSLAEWDNFSRIAREVAQIRADEERLTSETDELKLRAASATLDVPPSERAAARQLAQKQLELGRRLDKLQTRMEEMMRRLTADDPLAAAALADALDAARRLAIGEQMRQAASGLSQLQLGQARDLQQRVLDSLKQLLASLSMRRDDELARHLDTLRQASAELGSLVERGGKNEATLSNIANQPRDSRARELERLRRELEAFRNQTEQLARRLARLQARRAASSLGQAAASSLAAAQAAGAGDVPEAQQQTAQTRQRLEEAQDRLAQTIVEAEEELAREQLARVEQMIAAVAARQKNVIAETQRLEGQRDKNGRLEASQTAALKDVASEQRLLADETEQLRPRFSAAVAFGFALEGAAANMRRAGALLVRGQSAAMTQAAEQAALSRLEQILAALRRDETPPDGKSPGDGQEPMPQQPAGDFEAAAAELKLLKLLQEAINRRTAELELIRKQSGPFTADHQLELDALAREQGRLADIVLGLIEVIGRRPEDTPDTPADRQPRGSKLPDK